MAWIDVGHSPWFQPVAGPVSLIISLYSWVSNYSPFQLMMKGDQYLVMSNILPIAVSLTSSDFTISIDDSTGAVVGVRDPQANSSMNWVSSPSNAPWQPLGSQWGLGYADLGSSVLHRYFWNSPEISVDADGGHNAVYGADRLQLTVRRSVSDESGSFTERYTFTNRGPDALDLKSSGHAALAIYTPFNDHYTNTSDCLQNRAHAHVWANGGNTGWVKMNQMGGNGRNLGLVLIEGSLRGYSIESRDIIVMSNTRGVFLMHPSVPTLQPGESTSIAWMLFWHGDWDDFFEQCSLRSDQFIRFNIPSYTLSEGEDVTISMSGGVNADTTINSEAVSCEDEDGTCKFTHAAGAIGPKELHVETPTQNGLRESTIYLNTVPNHDDLISARVKFIVEHQQVRGQPEDPNNGGYAVYDNQAQTIAFWDKDSDRTTGRERLGMGILLSRYLRRHPDDDAARASLEDYYEFVCFKLQGENGQVYDRPIGSGTSIKRLYNWPWVLQLHISIAQLGLNLTGPVSESTSVERFMLTLENFYQEGGRELYAIGLPIFEALSYLEKHGHDQYYERTKQLFIQHGEFILNQGLDYPPFEVNFEQSIVAPAATLLLELYRATGNFTWLEAGEMQLETLLRFQGKQPDHRVHNIAIRHWDGYWFGKDRHWGDTFPHYWSTLDALALHHYAKAVGDSSYKAHADRIINNNLVLFSPNGTASCAWIYPLTVNGRKAHYPDPYANDQDWALNHLLYLRDDDEEGHFSKRI